LLRAGHICNRNSGADTISSIYRCSRYVETTTATCHFPRAGDPEHQLSALLPWLFGHHDIVVAFGNGVFAQILKLNSNSLRGTHGEKEKVALEAEGGAWRSELPSRSSSQCAHAQD